MGCGTQATASNPNIWQYLIVYRLGRENECAPGKAPKEGIIFTHAQLDPMVNIIGSNWSLLKLRSQENKNFLQTNEQKDNILVRTCTCKLDWSWQAY